MIQSNRKFISRQWIVLLPVLLLLISCAPSVGMKPRPDTSGEIESYYLSENTTQYFIRPIVTKAKGISISTDFTLRVNTEKAQKDQVVFNYTLERNIPFTQSLILSFILDDTDAVTPSQPDTLFTENENRIIRYTSQIPFYEFTKLISANRVDIVMLEGTNDVRFPINKKFYKVQKQLKFLIE